MLDVFGFPFKEQNTQIFRGVGGANLDWQIWRKPRGITSVLIIAIGPGGGGGGGFTRAPAAAGGGGGGGGPGVITRAIFPADTLPDFLYIQPSPGGPGGAGSSNGTAGTQ